ncbi:transcriptional regulator [Bradyrhizobium sp. SSBR45G]|uniref:LysR family transcriptional regulator n=1 Tax=unclassified Bradyrhizobium TaxID=2631580 RepID=UPI002342B101|nr:MULTISPECIES: LysR family transcriptional regulator [unclassified Bradyrhizobium]GLH81674.1 transcriptional regulator [Bradyrhizobium sp. SSBR45G]GLH89096.1 transcriptional regulator [Bradyrhizobium sp. SSBR45R]
MNQLAAMETFVKAVETGSLSAAARSLTMSLTAVSRHVSALEEQFGARLLLRTTRQLALTDEGRILYARAKSILSDIKDIEAALAPGRGEPAGRVRISSPSLIGRQLIAPLLGSFLRRYPAMSVDLLLVDRPVDMVEEDVHLSLRIGALADSQLVARKLADLQMIVCASPAYLDARGVPDSPDDLARHDCLVFSDRPGAALWRFDRHPRPECTVRISGRLWVNSLDAMVAAAVDGAGIARVPLWQVERELAAGRLQRILRERERAPVPLHALFQPSRIASPKTQLFVDFLVEQWRSSRPFSTDASSDRSGHAVR